MTGQIAGPSVFSLELVGLIVGISMIVGAVDLIRQPGWAWKRAQESKTAYLILVVLVPDRRTRPLRLQAARPKVAPITAAGRAASLPFERFGEDAAEATGGRPGPPGPVARPGGVRQLRGDHASDDRRRSAWESSPIVPRPAEPRSDVGSHLLQQRWDRHRPPHRSPDRPGPRRTGPGSGPACTESRPMPRPTVPAGWKADPTGRHQFRYWDGFQWTENVADAGEQSRDSVASSVGGSRGHPDAARGDQPAEPGHQHLEHGLARQRRSTPRRSRSASASSRTARAIRADPQPAATGPAPSWPGTRS